MKRTDYINWDEYFMGIALLTAMRSKYPNSQGGACIVSSENKILSLGYNGMPIGLSLIHIYPEEAKRKASLSASVVPVEYEGIKYNLIDAPGRCV